MPWRCSHPTVVDVISPLEEQDCPGKSPGADYEPTADTQRKRRRRQRRASKRRKQDNAAPKTPLNLSLTNSSVLGFISEQHRASRPFSRVPSSKPRDIGANPLRSLCKEQARLVEIIEEGHNVFFTGGAGTGKSTVLRAAVVALRRSGKHVAVVALTGSSALNVDGITYFVYAG
jgi:phosphate starvation-inducible protein PhoH